MGVFGGVGTEIRNAAVKGNCEFNQLNIRIAKSCFPLCCYFTYVITPWVNVFSKQDNSLSYSLCLRMRRQERISSSDNKAVAHPQLQERAPGRTLGACDKAPNSLPGPLSSTCCGWAAATRTEHLFDDSCTADLVGFTCNTSETKTEQAAAFRGLQTTYWEKTILGCGERERGKKPERS